MLQKVLHMLIWDYNYIQIFNIGLVDSQLLKQEIAQHESFFWLLYTVGSQICR